MMAEPTATPVNTPVEGFIVALADVLLQLPPGAASVSVIVEPRQTFTGPFIVPGLGSPDPIVMILVAVSEPQELVTIYLMVSVPGVTPVTTPEVLIVALPFVLLHTPVPLAKVSDKAIVEPKHTCEPPKIVPARGNGLIVT